MNVPMECYFRLEAFDEFANRAASDRPAIEQRIQRRIIGRAVKYTDAGFGILNFQSVQFFFDTRPALCIFAIVT